VWAATVAVLLSEKRCIMRKSRFLVVLGAAALLAIPGESSARPRHRGFRGGFHPGFRPGFGPGVHDQFDPRFNHGFLGPRFNRFNRFERRFDHGIFVPRFERRFFDPRFGGFSAP
jgi:hypothetical protein